MGSFPFAHTIISMPMADGGRNTSAHWDAAWWRRTPPASACRAVSAPLPFNDHHDIDTDSKCTRPGSALAGARAGAFALRLP